MKTLEQLRKSVGRELGMRRANYPRWLKTGKMSQEEFDHEIACMDQLYGMLKRAEADPTLTVAELLVPK